MIPQFMGEFSWLKTAQSLTMMTNKRKLAHSSRSRFWHWAGHVEFAKGHSTPGWSDLDKKDEVWPAELNRGLWSCLKLLVLHNRWNRRIGVTWVSTVFGYSCRSHTSQSFGQLAAAEHPDPVNLCFPESEFWGMLLCVQILHQSQVKTEVQTQVERVQECVWGHRGHTGYVFWLKICSLLNHYLFILVLTYNH